MLCRYCCFPKSARFLIEKETVETVRKVRNKKGKVVRRTDYETVEKLVKPDLSDIALPYGGKYIILNYMIRMALSALDVGTTLQCPEKHGAVDLIACRLCCPLGKNKCRGYARLLNLDEHFGDRKKDKKRLRKALSITAIRYTKLNRVRLAHPLLLSLLRKAKKIDKEYSFLRGMPLHRKLAYHACLERLAFKRYKKKWHSKYEKYDVPVVSAKT